MKSLTILGATGSIGVSTLDVVALHPGRYRVVALTGNSRVDILADQCARFQPAYAVVGTGEAAARLRAQIEKSSPTTEILHGPEALVQVASLPEVDAVMAAIVGAAGLPSALAAARAGKQVLLANKEALVTAGAVFMAEVARSGAILLPIDSEHNAVFQSLPRGYAGDMGSVGVRRVLLTASGGPFRNRAVAELEHVTPDQACAHPNWSMGRKISVDSATMMNKVLEVIEARFLFGVPSARISVVIHPQSVIHSMVQYRDNSIVAQLGTPDMRVPIAYGLCWPDRMSSGADALDFQTLAAMTFESMDDPLHRARFPGLTLAWQVLEAAHGTPAVLNAANEVAVEAFLAGRIRFDQIHGVNAHTLDTIDVHGADSLESLLELDRQARAQARRQVDSLAR